MSLLDEQLSAQLSHWKQKSLQRSLRVVPPDVLDLASNDYLGLAHHPVVIGAARAALEQYGAGGRASRLISGHNPLHAELESALAQWKQSEAALLLPSGYAANLAAIGALTRRGDLIFCDKRNHASLIDACRLAQSNGVLVRFYATSQKLENLLQHLAPLESQGRRVIVSDAVYSMDGDLADVPQLMRLAAHFSAVLLLDDAHGGGTLGARGAGAVEHFWPNKQDRPHCDLVQIGTLSKALGSQGGFVAASRRVIDWLITAARSFIYTTALNPAACGAALGALQVLASEPQRLTQLRENTATLANALNEQGFEARLNPTPIIPVMLGLATRAVTLSEKLLARGVWCPAIRPPTVPIGASRLRVTVSAALAHAEIERIVQAFTAARKELD